LGAKVGAAPYLTIVPDGALNYIPFAALRDPERSLRPYLVQQAVITIAPALRLLAASAHRAPAGGETGLGDRGAKSAGGGDRMLLVADAVYTADDPRVQAVAATLQTTPGTSRTPGSIPSDALIFRSAVGSNDLVRLPATGREAERIRAEYGDGRVDLLGGLDATRDTFLAKDFSTYRFIHIAVHGVIDAEIPQLSALVLGNYGRSGPVGDPAVRAGDLLAKTFNAEAVVLSACDSALGKEYVGEGLIGLRYAALARGAHAVIASLWPVSDGIAADLMTEMYRQIATHDTQRNPAWTGTASENVALSLTTAIRQVLDQTPALDPALWAPFSVYVAGD
jgi:CHAT domain-containing protein